MIALPNWMRIAKHNDTDKTRDQLKGLKEALEKQTRSIEEAVRRKQEKAQQHD